MEQENRPRKLRLMRPTNSAKQNIKQNLRPLEMNTKKKLAQALYYENQMHQSPLMREAKAPVHQRLGAKQIRLKRFVPLGTNTASVLPRRKMLRRYPNTVGNQFRQNKMQRVYSAQSRLERIRSQQRNGRGIIKLRRLNGGGALRPPSVANLTVEVKNPNYVPGMPGYNGSKFAGGYYKFKMILDPVIQEEIDVIQRDRAVLAPLPPSTRFDDPIHITDLKISERFGLL